MIKKNLHLLSLIVFFNNVIFAQWSQLNSGTTNILNSVLFLDADTGFVAGNLGTILKTTDGGANWTNQTSSTTHNLTDVFFTNSQNGYVVTNLGERLKTTNSGSTWTMSGGGSDFLKDVCFSNDSTGFIVGLNNGNVLKTTNSGNSWTQLTWSLTPVSLTTAYFTSKDTGYVAGNGVYKTNDGGVNWSQQSFETGLESLHFPTKDTGYAIGYGSGNIIKTINGGISWVPIPTGVATDAFYSAHFVNSAVGYIAGGFPITGFPGKILKTVDGGNTWATQVIPSCRILNSIHFPSTLIGYAVGEDGTILKTINGGVTKVNELESSNDFKFYPNPITDYTTIKFDDSDSKSYSMEIYNSVGEKILYLKSITNGETLDLQKLSIGIYTLKIFSQNVFYTAIKLIKTK